jgi:hypothetical protein
MFKSLSLSVLIAASIAVCAQPAVAAEPAQAKSTKKAAHKAPAKAAPHEPNEEEDEPDTKGSTTTDYTCELGNSLTIFQNADDDKHVALRWHKRIHRLTRVGTTTGANRFENHYYGLVWIGIPAKGMLLDSKQGHQLANDCKTAEQMKAAS